MTARTARSAVDVHDWRSKAVLPVTVVGLYLLTRLVDLLALGYAAHDMHTSLLGVLSNYDGYGYRLIVAHGYPVHWPADEVPRDVRSTIAFFPLLPAAMSALTHLGLSAALAGVLFVAVVGACGAWGIFLVGREVRDARTGVLLVVLFGILPSAWVESMTYTEAPFTAFAAFCLYAVLRRRWVAAGVLCALAGLTRSTGVALVAAVAVAAVLAAVRRENTWRSWVGVAIAPLGLLAFWGWLGIRTGRMAAWFIVQKVGWGVYFDGGLYTSRALRSILLHGSTVSNYVVTAVIAGFGLLVIALWRGRFPAPLVVYGAASYLLIVGTYGYFHSKSRLLLPAFVVLLPLATWLSRRPKWVVAAALTVLLVLSAAYAAYYTEYVRASP